MMYETESGSGEYQTSSDTTWPKEGYTFNLNVKGVVLLVGMKKIRKFYFKQILLINVMCILISMKFLSLIK